MAKWEKVRYPQAVAEQLRDHGALRVAFVLGDGLCLEVLLVEIAGQDEAAILPHVIPGEMKEGMFGLEVADLQGTVHPSMETGTTGSEQHLLWGERQVLRSLPVVEIGQAIQGILLGVR